MALTRSEALTLFLFLTALTTNIVLLNDKALRILNLCGEALVQISCESNGPERDLKTREKG